MEPGSISNGNNSRRFDPARNDSVTGRILRDMQDGVMMVSTEGNILFVNNAALGILGFDSDELMDQKYAAVFVGDSANDSFNQLIFDSIYDQENAHSGTTKYHHGGHISTLDLTTSFLYDEKTSKKSGIIAVFKDITEQDRLNRLKKESALLFSLLLIGVGINTFFWQAIAPWINDGTIPSWIMSRMVELIAVILFIVAITRTSMTLKDLGLITQKRELLLSLKEGFIFSIGIFALMCAIKAALAMNGLYLNYGRPFWDWSVVNLSDYTYFLIAPAQEFLARGVTQGTLERIVGNDKKILVVLLSSIIFGTLHASYGFSMMVFAFLMSFALGFLYYKQKNIWGCSVIHWTIGIAGEFLGFYNYDPGKSVITVAVSMLDKLHSIL